MTRFLAAALLLGAVAISTNAVAGETRREAVTKADVDNNMRLDGKEMKTLKKEHRMMYDNLTTWCEDASEHPTKNGVEFPVAVPEGQMLDCKKKHVAKPFINAWLAQVEKEAEAPPPPAPSGLSPTEAGRQ